jgi:hypothetical protein
MLKNPTGMKRILRGQNSLPFLAKFSFFVTRCLCCNFQRALLGESGMITTQMGIHNRSEMVAVYGKLFAIQHATKTAANY